MKKSGQIVNSPVISIQEGLELGTVRELVVNPDKKSVEFLLVDKNEGSDENEILAIPFREAVGVGNYAVTIEHQRVLLDLNKMNIAGSLLENRVNIIDEKVVTRKGKLLGSITDYMVDTETGSIPQILLLVEETGQEGTLPLETLVSIGRQVVIVSEEAADLLTDSQKTDDTATEAVTETPVSAEAVESFSYSEESLVAAPVEEMVEQESGSSVEMFIARQKSFLLGKELKQDLKDLEGNVIAAAGTVITPDIFDQVQGMGRQKVIELTMLTE
ncbi:PRC-barrel domain-containing protein [Anoxynatronum buryatiense]|uniref:Uncharacterized protein YrrD, contains PRC-barrel domain n=1 Tax=Anoxynatronum buryatiense TaxID=489973 RepID=A0AA45WYR9_9CLOT|nr:PRC-barrel domain-containing protein [Anoxynatronum buryatiense]SMP64929.1 Uncharacterized protein YrrD, contains PRC-barrel domain [Anoxynatronum buryatiense]